MEMVAEFRKNAEKRGIHSQIVEKESFADVLCSITSGKVVASADRILGHPMPDWVTTEPTMANLENATVGITPGSFGIASEGAVVVEQGSDNAGPVSIFTDHHIAVIDTDDIYTGIDEVFEEISARPSKSVGDFVIVSGPSKTSDMGEAVTGIHGPSEVTTLLITHD